MLKLLQIFTVCFMAMPAGAQAQSERYATTCVVKDGQAVGYIASLTRESLDFGGRIYFYLYNSDNEQIDQKTITATVSTRDRDLFRIGETDVSRRAVGCAVDVTEAVGDREPGNYQADYLTSCEILEHHAQGYVQLMQNTSLSFSGRVFFVFYDEDGDFLRTNDTITSDSFAGRGRYPAADIRFRNDAVWCVFSIEEAIDR